MNGSALLAILVATGVIISATSCHGADDLSGTTPDKPRPLPVLWRNPLGSGSSTYNAWTSGIPAVAGGTVYVEDQNNIVALNAATGAMQWTTSVKDFPNPAAPNLVVTQELVIVGDRDVEALNAVTGVLRWRFQTDSLPDATAAADADAYYTAQRSIPVVYALNLTDGSLRWRVNVGPDWQYPAFVRGVSVSGDTVYAGVHRYQAWNGYLTTGVIVALDRRTGKELWRYETPDQHHDINWAPLVVGNLLVLDDLIGHGVFAIDRFNPTAGERWRLASQQGNAGPTTPSIVLDGRVFAATGGGYAYAIDPVSGAVIWQQETKDIALGLTACNGSPYINTTSLQRRDPTSGVQLGYLNGVNGASFTSGLAAQGTTLYATGRSGVVAVTCP